MAVTGGRGRSQDRAPGNAAGGSELPADGPELAARAADGTELSADGTELSADGTELSADGTELSADGTELSADGTQPSAGTEPSAHGTEPSADGTEPSADGTELSAQRTQLPATGHGGAHHAGYGHRRGEEYRGEQGVLFGEDLDSHPDDAGYRGPSACAAAGITYRQLDYWARTGLVEPSVRPAHGSGSQRLYGFRDILVLKVVKRLLDTGISLQQIRAAVQHLRDHGAADLAQVTLMSDGVSVYECTSPDEVVDLLQGGQGVFGIALGRIWREVEGTLAELPAEKTADAQGGSGVAAVAAASDELAHRRARKTG